MKVFVFDSTKCNGCYGCQLACKDEHWNNEWPPYALPPVSYTHLGNCACHCAEEEAGF